MSNIIFMARLTDQGDFAAVRRAEQLLKQHGFSVGTTQRGSPRGIMFGAYDIQKWRNLNEADRAALLCWRCAAMHNRPGTTGFNLPSAFKSHSRKHDHLIAIASLIASVCVAAILGAQILGLI
ncbi:hypothetical protein ABE527_10330 [Brucella sp. TWI432]